MSHDNASLHGHGHKKSPGTGGDKKKNDSKLKKKAKKTAPTELSTADAVLVHGELLKRKCDIDVEPWVKCGQCSRWLHQVCGLYNPVAGVYAADNDYVCPLCIWKQRAPACESKTDLHSLLNPVAPPQTRSSSCQEIPSCELSEFIEKFLRRGLRDLSELEAADSLHVRVLSFPNERVHVPEGVVQTFDSNASLLEQVCESSEPRRLPHEIAFTSRGIYLFQRHEGCDVCLFTLFVQEFGDDCALPSNRRSVYVAYLDSIRYLSPPSARTASYHLVMMAYFDYIRRHGFERVHIWSCPPQRRISYVFWCRPPFQKTPSAEHLRAWYKRLLTKAQDANIVRSWTTTYDRYFSSSSPLPAAALSGGSGVVPLSDSSTTDGVTCNGASSSTVATRGSTSRSIDPNELHWPAPELPPIFEGDFLPAELERILGYIAAKNAKCRRASKKSGGKSSLVGSTGGKLAVGEVVTRLKEDPPAAAARVEIKLREVFVRCQQAVQRLRNDLLVVDLVVPEHRPCDPTRLVPAWWSQVPRFFGSRFMFHQLCATASYQFDSLRRAKHSTMMVLHHFFNERVCQLNVFCHECCLLITHIEQWTCVQCEPAVALCDTCYERQRRPATSTTLSPLPPHGHAMVYRRQSE
ncbi:hypothetical protein PINS_up008617 [Pythium insidiosum]|nr:hypothetical protein PINS_up008617 [Pythium insidiosum]